MKDSGMSMDDLRSFVARLDISQRIFLANHMWKHYRVYPTKLREFIPEDVLFMTHRFKTGDLVRVKNEVKGCALEMGEGGVITYVAETYSDKDDAIFEVTTGRVVDYAKGTQLEKIEPSGSR